jgi:hypothetical protein
LRQDGALFNPAVKKNCHQAPKAKALLKMGALIALANG